MSGEIDFRHLLNVPLPVKASREWNLTDCILCASGKITMTLRCSTSCQCTLINFIATEKGLEDQLLAKVVGVERPELEKQAQELQAAFNQVPTSLCLEAAGIAFYYRRVLKKQYSAARLFFFSRFFRV